MTDYIIDIETDGLDATKIHCMSVHNGKSIETFTKYADMQVFLATVNRLDRIIGHNFIRYDAPVIERILGTNMPCQIVDTLALSWYLYHAENRHGLEQWGERLGVAKPQVQDWENADLETYVHRCEQDVKINYLLWTRQHEYLNNLYTDKPEPIIKYLMFKMKCAALQEKCKWKLDVTKANTLLDKLESEYDELCIQLKSVMPQVPKVAKRHRPAKPFKQDGTLSAHGLKWKGLCDKNNVDFDSKEPIEETVGFDEPNPNSVFQVKNWLTSLGWKPITFEYKAAASDLRNKSKSKENYESVPQVKIKDGGLCKSVIKLIPENPEIKALDTITLIKHRIGSIKHFLKNVDERGFVKAEIGGLTNTLRFTHRVCVNIPSSRKLYGLEIRELLTVSNDDNILCGSDLASLEDRTKQHFMWNHDRDFVKEMMVDDFDPHLDLALSASAVTEEQVMAYKYGDDKSISTIRHNFKGGNYACTYGCGVTTLSRQLGIEKKEAEKIHKAYWKRNWSLKKIASESTVKNVNGNLWLLNPVSKLWYSLRAEKDIFSTLNQGTGTFCFDMWLGFIIQKRPQLTAQFHDEVILECSESEKEEIGQILSSSLEKVNNLLKLNRDLGCDVQFGKNYSQIH